MKPYHKFILKTKKEPAIPCLDKPKHEFVAKPLSLKAPCVSASVSKLVGRAGRSRVSAGSRGREIFNLVIRELRQFWEYQRCR